MMTLHHSALPFNHIDIRMKCLLVICGSFKRALFFFNVWYFSWKYFRMRILLFFYLHLFLASGRGGGSSPPKTPYQGATTPWNPFIVLFFCLIFSLELLYNAHFAIFHLYLFPASGGLCPQPLTKGHTPFGTPSMGLQLEKSWLRPWLLH